MCFGIALILEQQRLVESRQELAYCSRLDPNSRDQRMRGAEVASVFAGPVAKRKDSRQLRRNQQDRIRKPQRVTQQKKRAALVNDGPHVYVSKLRIPDSS